MISSIHNQRVKDAVKLRDRRGRIKQQRFLVDGIAQIQRALQSDLDWYGAFLCPQIVDDRAAEIERQMSDRQIPIWPTTLPVWEKLAFGDQASGVVAVLQTPNWKLADWKPDPRGLYVVLEGVEKPGNVGAVLRTSAAVGASGVIVADGRCDLFNPNTIRASLGTLFHVPVVSAESPAARAWLAQGGQQIFAARVGDGPQLWQADLRPACALVLGSEAHGLSGVWSGPDITSIHLPMQAAIDSLNVSTTAAVMLYEAMRQRQM